MPRDASERDITRGPPPPPYTQTLPPSLFLPPLQSTTEAHAIAVAFAHVTGRAYRRKALLWHPDKLEQNKSEDGFYVVDGQKVDKAKAEAMFKDLNEANEVLTDPTKKRRSFPLLDSFGALLCCSD